MRGRPELEAWGRECARGGGGDLRRLAAHPRGARGGRRPRRARPRGAAGRRRRRVRPAGPRDEALAELLAEARADPPNPGNAEERLPDEGNAERLAAFLADDEPTVVYFGKLIGNKGVHLLLEALDGLDARAVIVGFGDYRAELERHGRGAGERVSSPARSSTATSSTCSRSPTSPSCRRSSRRRSGWSPPRPRPAAARRSSPATPASPRSRPGSRRSTRRTSPPGGVRDGNVADLRAKLAELLALAAPPIARRCASAARRAVVERWSWAGVAARLARAGRVAFAGHGRGTTPFPRGAARDRPRRRSRTAPTSPSPSRRSSRSSTPRRSRSSNRFEDVQAAARGTELEPHLVGELIASEVEVRTGKCVDFGEAAAKMAERRAQLQALARELGLQLGATGTHPWSRWQDQRIIDTPHYRRNDELLRYVVWRNNTFGLHVHVGIRGGDRAIAVCNAMRRLPARAARAVGELAVRRGGRQRASTRPARRSSRACSRAAGSRTPTTAGRGSRTTSRSSTGRGSIDEHTQLWWSVRPHLAYPTVEIRICDAQPDLAEAQSARGARLRARRPLRAGARRGRAAARPAEPAARGEPLARDPLRALRAS